ncbi:MAG: methylglyoxal synthase [Oscillospiraceae bacterium]|jgi:methylglyoxal synthase|nr:methylglyoxal synthase [Oscillospiraceae bacterium]
MNIALLAHDNRKELMVQFCIAYCGVLARHSVCATATTARFVSEATGLPVTPYLSHAQGGVSQISARISYNELDLVLFFSDPSTDDNGDVNEVARACDRYNVPFASNAATAEALVLALRRGDLDWRELVNPKKK